MAMENHHHHHPESSHREERTAANGGGVGGGGGRGEEEMVELMYSKRGCCFWMPYFGSSGTSSSSQSAKSDWWERIRSGEREHQEEKWWKNVFLKVREWSEIVAGPRWKTFIRRFKKNHRSGCCGGGVGGGSVTLGKYQYDPLSYALNFEEQNDVYNEDFEYPDFSSRYASIPMSAKSSMDLGKDGPSFT